jgi:hypothetical protein
MVSSGGFSTCFCAFLAVDDRSTAIVAPVKSGLPEQKYQQSQ